MSFNLDNPEKRFFVYATVILFLWFTFGVSYIGGYVQSNFMMIYTFFSLIYAWLIFKYVLNLPDDSKLFIAFFMTMLIGDIILFPYLVNTTGLIQLPGQAMLSSDIYIWHFLPANFPPLIKYYIIYVVVPALGLLLARFLAGKKDFKNILKSAF